MQPVSSTVWRARHARVLGAMLVPLALGVVACSSGGGHARADAGSATTRAAHAGSTTTVGAETGGTVGDATTKWCVAFRSLDQDPASVDEISMLSVVLPQDDLEFPWI